MKKYFFLLIGITLFTASLYAQPNKSKSELPGLLFVSAVNVPETYSLFGEKVPLELWDVKERFDRELLINTYLQGSSLYVLKLYTRWIPMIEARLKANNIPDDFKYLCIAESALQNQVSKAGAVGFWQFMRSTAPHLRIGSECGSRRTLSCPALKFIKGLL